MDLTRTCSPLQVGDSSANNLIYADVPPFGTSTTSQQYIPPVLDITVGKNTTSAYAGIDIAVNKVAIPVIKNFPPIDTHAIPTPQPIVVGTDTEPIIFTNQINNIGISSGYFVVEVDCLFKSNLVGMDAYSDSIHSIVSRYYTANNYTSGADDPIIYENIGAPTMLSQLRIRILNPDRTNVDKLGEDNTVFLRLMKGQQTVKKK